MITNIIEKIREIQSTKGNSIVIIGIDGGGGSGKTTLANNIASKLQHTQIIHMDDFYKEKIQRKIAKLIDAPIGYEYDIDRLISQVIIPILSDKSASYQKYDWDNDCLSEFEAIIPTSILIIEGCYSTVKQLRRFYHLNIFVYCDKNLRLKRGLERDGESALQFWLNWIDGEDKFFTEQCPQNNADFIFVTDCTL